MNRILHKLIFLALIPVLTLAGCQSSDEPAPAPGGNDAPMCSFSIYISTGDGAGSRAPSDGEYNPGAGFENYIDISGEDFAIAIYDIDDKWMANVESAVIVPYGDDFLSAKRYLLQCNIDRETADAINEKKSIKLVMMANWHHTYPRIGENSDLKTLFDAATTMDYSKGLPGPVLSREDKIAMFGVCQYDNIELKPNIVKELGTLHLLRALAKIEVWDSPETVQRMKSVSITRHKTAAAPMPKGVTHQSHYVKGNYAGDYVTTPSFPDNWGPFDNENTEPVAMTADDNGHYIIYVPEFRNNNRSHTEQKARLMIEYEDREPYFIEFLDAEKKGIDILRNYWYRFIVNKTNDQIEVHVDVLPYSVKELNPDYGLNVPEVVNPTLRQQWRSHEGFTDYVRSGNGFGGKVYLVDTYDIRTFDGEKLETVFHSDTQLNKGLFVDEAGNMLIKRDWPSGDWSKFTLISADGKTVKNVTVNKPVNSNWAGARSDMNGRAIGNFFSEEGGLCYLTADGQNVPIPLWFKNGEFQTVQNGTSAKFPTANTMAYAQPAVESMSSINGENVADCFYYHTSSSTMDIGYVDDAGEAAYLKRPESTDLPADWAVRQQNGFDVVVLGGKKYIFRMADAGAWGANFIVHDEGGNIVAKSGYNNANGWGSIGNAGWGSGIFVRKVSETKAEVYQIFKGTLEASFSAMYIFEVP